MPTRKVREAIAVWLLEPTAIEADFRREYHDVTIADWLHGRMSSREFLVLVDKLPDRSAFKRDAPKPFGRDGDWTDAMEIAKETHKELALYRASKYAGGCYEYAPMVFLNPSERIDAAERAREEALAAMDLEQMLSRSINKTTEGR